MSIILYSSLIVVILSLTFFKEIHRYKNIIYILTLIASLLLISTTPNIVNTGYIPFSIFLIVIFSGLLDKGLIRKRLFMVRAELAIIGSVLLIPHAFGYLEFVIERDMFFNSPLFFYLGILAIIVMLPLTITSFKIVRKRMKYKQWKKLHKLSYVFFLLVGLHLILLQNDRMVFYIIIFGFYFGMKSVIYVADKYISPKLKKQSI